MVLLDESMKQHKGYFIESELAAGIDFWEEMSLTSIGNGVNCIGKESGAASWPYDPQNPPATRNVNYNYSKAPSLLNF